ncbi:Lpg1974 family pore-forming outer membrane protein [Legionella donaldsonii]|uniref:Lpg1974 family pore-forming outer membrane protein n=1 Tax=Legionella donaldsonii TaxID=45060 RepID=UPI00399C5BA9
MKYALSSALVLSLVASGDALALSKEPSLCEGSSALCAMITPGGLYANVTGYYFRPSETGIGMATDSWQYGSAAGGISAVSKPADPDGKWSASFLVGYDIPDSANNIELSYLYLNNRNHAVNTNGDGPITFGAIFFPDVTFPFAPGQNFVSDAQLRYRLDQVDLTVGRTYIDYQGQFMLHPKVGVRYAKLDHEFTFLAPGNVMSEFRGAGPLLGMDGRYSLFQSNFGLVGNFEYAPIVGNINSHSFLNFPIYVTYSSPKRDRIVNSFTAKLGIDYNYTFRNSGYAAVEVGYQVNQYNNAMDMIRGNYAVAGAQKVTGVETTTFNFHGPYVSLSVHA